ncbi:hypothetical protein MBLNU459_g4998t2 [Dothideomycetes sp. NU459]
MSVFQQTLPASWYCSPALYQLERRAVFRTAWYLLGPVTKFADGEGVQYEIAQVSLTARRTPGPEDIRDIKVTADEDGRELRSHLTRTGLLFTTISEEAPSFADYFPDLEDTLAPVDFTQRPYKRSIKYEGGFNWKTMYGTSDSRMLYVNIAKISRVDGYQECLHCQYTHPAFSVLYPPTFYNVINHTNWCRHIADPDKPDDGLFLYFFPNCTLNVYGGGMSSFRICPTDQPGTTRMEFDYFHFAEGDKFEEYYKFVRQVALEDYELCEKAQENLEKGIYSEGILNPDKETGVAYYQQRVLELVTKRHAKEKAEEEQRVLPVERIESRQAQLVA